MQRILIAVVMGITMLILTGFCFFAAFYYCDDDSKPERILLTVIGCIAALVSVLVVIGLMTC